MSFTVEDLARTALVRILPRSRYRLAGQNDSRFTSLAANTSRIAYRQQGGTPAFLLFSGAGQDPRAAAAAAAAWAEASWRPNAIQRTVRPGVVVVQVAPAAELSAAGLIPGTAVPSAVWTVDSDSGSVTVAGNPPGSPSGSVIKQAASELARGVPAPSLGELDLAERAVMQVRTVGMPRMLGGVAGLLLILFALRYGLGGVFGLFALPGALQSGNLVIVAGLLANLLLVVGILAGLAVLFNLGNFANRAPGVSSPVQRTRNLTWAGYAAAMIALAIIVDGVVPAVERSTIAGSNNLGQYQLVTATANDDGSETYVATGGHLIVDLSGWPRSEWSGVQFKSSNPSVLSRDLLATGTVTGGKPIARFTANEPGAARVDATSVDGRYTFQLRVNVIGG